ncbi:MAG: crossover junction endodeoxyribonuclease RuvC [Candidatus Buchananbacteria bacterium]|nr:crossover junction endodeoxyribonuclease RuvC [Candidatus Buchananbacteria bacterium]
MPVGKKVTILGIDPGLADTGYGIITSEKNKIVVVSYGSIVTDKKLATADRLKRLENELKNIIATYKPEIIGVEQLFFCNNAKTIINVGQARGVILLTAAKNNLIIKEFTPLQVKQGVTGYGQADKKQVQQMVKTILGLKQIPQPDDAADALAIAICAINK